MYLKTLELHGFKSFADRTDLEFHPGVTGIVGPNGCGKSNVVDAIRWVLGETSAKALRGSEMADVIFSGTDKRKPMGMAEVTLTFADCEQALGLEFNEVAVTRRVFRDGRGEYLLNGSLCRLKDIQDMFMDTGIGRTSYSIMAQGQIDMLLSSKPEDRRAVFEEAAGITKFKKQKKESLRKLEYTEANLLRLTDILAEVRRQMNSLQRQAAKARRYQALIGDVRVLDTHLSFKHYTELSAQKGELETNIASLRKQIAGLEQQVADRESALDGARLELAQLDNRIGEARATLNDQHARVHTAEARIQSNDERTQEWRDAIAANQNDIQATDAKLNQQQLDLWAADEALASLSARIEAQRASVAEAEGQAAALQEKRAGAAAQLAAGRKAAVAAEASLAGLVARLESTRAQRRADETRLQALHTETARAEEGLAAQKTEFDAATARIDAMDERLAALGTEADEADRGHRQALAELAALRDRMAGLRRRLAEKSARLEVVRGLVLSGEGLDSGTQAVLAGLDDPALFQAGLRGLLAHSLDVPDELVHAIEGALGNRLGTVVVEDSALAARMVDALREGSRGTAVLAAIDLLPDHGPGQMLTVPDGAVGWAMDKVAISGPHKRLFEGLLRNVLIVPDLAAALRLRPQWRDVVFATLAGETVTPEGLLTGGRRAEQAPSILARRNEIRALEKAVAKLEADLKAAAGEEETLAARVADQAKCLDSLRSQIQQAALEKSTLGGQASLLRREIEQLASRLDQLRWELDEIRQRVDQAGVETTRLEADHDTTRLELDGLRDGVRAGETALEDLAAEEATATARAAEIRTALAVEERSRQSLEEQLKPMAARLQELTDLIERRRQECATHEGRITAAAQECDHLRAGIAEAKARAEALQGEIAGLATQRGTHAESLRTAEQSIQALRKEAHSLGEQCGREEVHATQVELRLENTAETCHERHGVELATFEQDIHALRLAIESQRKAMRRRASAAAAAGGDGEAPAAETEAPAPPAEEAEALPHDEEGPDWAFVESIVGELRQRLEAMGPVNLDAITEFEELEERHNFLQAQNDDLVKSKQELLEIIEHINKETRIRFTETFEQVRENFGRMFKTLFGERAQANLILLDESDPLESGIEISAKPPGKKLQSISLLSGGERSLTAVALLFSIYLVKPSPFCVLDELDAPLDESNIGRFLKVLDSFIDKSQFIIVTHSKRTMARADVMYGVTMEEFGVSKPVGMRLTKEDVAADQEEWGGEAEEKPEEDLTAAERAARELEG